MNARISWDGLRRAGSDAGVDWMEGLPVVAAMRACRQDPEWHAEGDVWTHTRLVCDALAHVDGWADLQPDEQAACRMAALFHDSGKPATTTVDPATGRVHAPQHALVGSRIARRELAAIGCPLDVRERIAALVRSHARPLHPIAGPEPGREVIRLSWLLDTRLLEIVARADFRGRECRRDGTPAEEAFALWRLICEEHVAYGRRHPFANDLARFRFFHDDRFDLSYVPHERWRCRVTMVSGLPGAGKDAWLAAARPTLPIVSLDAIRDELGADPTGDQGSVAQAAKERCREHLRAGRDFAFNATNLRERTRARWVRLFDEYGARVEIVYVEPPLPTILDRNRRRDRRVPDEVILRLWERIEPPTWTECHDLILVQGPAG